LAIIAVFLAFYKLWIAVADIFIPHIGLWLSALIVYMFSVQKAHHLHVGMKYTGLRIRMWKKKMVWALNHSNKTAEMISADFGMALLLAG